VREVQSARQIAQPCSSTAPFHHRVKGQAMADETTNKLLLVIIAILIPPLAVGLKAGVGGALILNIVLTLLFYLPGLLHALYVVLN
jgi:uncharacterized membrane protein YqaE (UPF0057 family)